MSRELRGSEGGKSQIADQTFGRPILGKLGHGLFTELLNKQFCFIGISLLPIPKGGKSVVKPKVRPFMPARKYFSIAQANPRISFSCPSLSTIQSVKTTGVNCRRLSTFM